ncbi:MAG: lipoate--protein ligase family protein [Candidatus Omnitrophica bacterium]|nr:lipoate--protein ligase family protein [Candidatus Omnitrophota bacterium]
MNTFRLIRSPAASASYNMALDAKIFSRYLQDGIPVLRLYRWKTPSFTYGFSHKPEEQLDMARCASDGVEAAKRITGGGVLFHHDEITYSFVCSKQDIGEPQGELVSYRRICRFLIEFYALLSVRASFAVEAGENRGKFGPHPLCSASNEKYDIVINGRKIGGNAQKRNRDAIFQHGSIPCSVDWGFVRRYVRFLPVDIAGSVTTLSEELTAVPGKDILEDKIIQAFAGVFDAYFKPGEESLYETAVA